MSSSSYSQYHIISKARNPFCADVDISVCKVRLFNFSDGKMIWKKGSFLQKNQHLALIQQDRYWHAIKAYWGCCNEYDIIACDCCVGLYQNDVLYISCLVTPSTFPLQWQSADSDRSGSSAREHPVPDPRDTGESDHRVLSWRQLRLLYTVPWLSCQTGKNSYTCKEVHIVLPQTGIYSITANRYI